jgi:hypothetical protein
MHSLDFANCVKGVPLYGNQTYCPHLASLSSTGVHYLQALTPKPSDSFPGLVAQITGGTPRSAGIFYDVSYDRALSPPAKTTPYGIVGGAKLCPSVVGTQVGFDEEIDYNYLKLDSGVPNGSSGINGINPDYLPRNPKNGCAPVYPHNYIRDNTIFNVVKNSGGYTAWSDKHPSYDFTNGPSGDGVDDLWSPEINSIPKCRSLRFRVAIRSPIQARRRRPTPGPTASRTFAATTSTRCRPCSTGSMAKRTMAAHRAGAKLFGMNFQSVSVGEKLVEKSLSLTGGYTDALGTPSESLLQPRSSTSTLQLAKWFRS